jgi:hypothetical protein
VQLEPDSLRRLEQLLPAGMTLERQGAFEGVTGTIRHLIAQRASAFVCELFELSHDPHDLEHFGRRQAATILGHRSFVATAASVNQQLTQRWLFTAPRLSSSLIVSG